MKLPVSLIFAATALTLHAQTTVKLPEVTVYSPRVANQSPAGTFAMPVSALRYEPRVDIQARNLTEGQADVTIRGGTFETTGFQIGAVTLLDPQTGHYFAEIPVAPAMLGAPEVLTGIELARVTNTTVGAVDYAWRPIRTAGSASVGAGEFGLWRADLYQGIATGAKLGAYRVAADVAVAHSESDGSVPFGEHRFDRVNGRFQLAGDSAQTDFFAGYQAKFFGWPNLYTPFNSNETENLATLLFAVNHRADLGGGDFVEVGAYHRRNKDDYAFNRFAPLVGPAHPFQHTTRISGAALGGRRDVGPVVLNFHGELLADDLKSTSLTAGRYHSRTISKLSLLPEKTWGAPDGSRTVLKLGAAYDDTDRDGGRVSPLFSLARETPSSGQRLYFSYSESSQVPSYTALNSSAASGLFRGNPDLGRETSRNLEVGVSGTLEGWTGQAAVFWRQEDSLVDWTFRRGVTARTASAVDVDTAGFEAVVRRSWAKCDLVLGYTALTKDADYRGATVDASFYALNYARHRLTAALTVRLGEGFEIRMDNTARIQADNLLRVTGGNDTVFTSLGVAYRPLAWRGAEVSLQVDNLWDSDYQEVPAVPAARRQLSGGVSYTW